jgi:hypothetical protein
MFSARGRSLGAVALKVLPGIAIRAVHIGFAFRRRVILQYNVSDDFEDLVRADSLTPTQVLHCIVDALLTGMTDTLHGVPSYSTHTCGLVARAHVYRVCRMSKVEAASELALLE